MNGAINKAALLEWLEDKTQFDSAHVYRIINAIKSSTFDLSPTESYKKKCPTCSGTGLDEKTVLVDEEWQQAPVTCGECSGQGFLSADVDVKEIDENSLIYLWVETQDPCIVQASKMREQLNDFFPSVRQLLAKNAELESQIGELDTAHRYMHERNERLEKELADARAEAERLTHVAENLQKIWSAAFDFGIRCEIDSVTGEVSRVWMESKGGKNKILQAKLNQALEAFEWIAINGYGEQQAKAREAIQSIKGEST